MVKVCEQIGISPLSQEEYAREDQYLKQDYIARNRAPLLSTFDQWGVYR